MPTPNATRLVLPASALNMIIVSESSAKATQPVRTADTRRQVAAAQRHAATATGTWTHGQSAFTQMCSQKPASTHASRRSEEPLPHQLAIFGMIRHERCGGVRGWVRCAQLNDPFSG
jgi:hypothetical protein